MIRRLWRALPWFAFGVFLTGFVIVVVWSAGRQPANPNTGHESDYSRTSHKQHRTVRNWITQDAAGFFTFWLVIVGFGQAVLFFWQLKIMRGGIENARVAAVAAQATAETAKEQVAVTRMGVIDLERAYLAVGPTEIIVDYIRTDIVRARGFYDPSTDPKELTVHLFIHNTGRTGATIKKVYGLLTDSPPLGDVPLYPPLPKQPTDTDLAVPAGAASKLDPFEFKSEFVGPQFFWGYIEYKDIFRNTRTSRFCTRLEPGAPSERGKYQIAGTDKWRECD